jgi:hypothetical protein
VQIVWSSWRGSRRIEHLGSAHDEAGLGALRQVAAERIAAGQVQLDLGSEWCLTPPVSTVPSRPLRIAVDGAASSTHARRTTARCRWQLVERQGVEQRCRDLILIVMQPDQFGVTLRSMSGG